MKLKEICQRTGISKRNIHYYVQEGLLKPVPDPDNGYYEFTEEDCDRLRIIRALRNADFSIAHIRALLDAPSTGIYYMNLRLKQLRAEQNHTAAIIDSLLYIQKRLPLRPGYGQLASLIEEADIPSPLSLEETDLFDPVDQDLVSRYLWESFLPDPPFTEYQEYLWNKVGRFTEQNTDCRTLNRTLQSLSEQEISRSFTDNRSRHMSLARLDPSRYEAYAGRMKETIRRFLQDPSLIQEWKYRYDTLTFPSLRIYDSPVSATMAELSPMFAAYRTSAHAVCQLVFDWLQSAEGRPLKERMEEELAGYLDIEHWSHGLLLAMVSGLLTDDSNTM